MNKYDLYTLCAQNPPRDARALRSIYLAGKPDQPRRTAITLGEDFSAAAALSREWCRAYPASRAIAVDRDPEALAHAKPHTRVKRICSDVRAASAKADLIAVLNFSICEIHHRRDLVAYLTHARSRLRRSGCFVCDLYSGADAYLTGIIRQRVTGPKGERITYQWEQRTADPLTGRVTNAMHFDVAPPSAKPTPAKSTPASRRTRPTKRVRLHDAFVYNWRLWSVPELSEAMRDAGFSHIDVYPRTADAIDHTGELYFSPVQSAAELGDSFNVFIAARTPRTPRTR